MTAPSSIESSKIRPYKVLRRETVTLPDRDETETVVLVEVGDYNSGDHRGAIRQAVKDHGFAQFVAVAESSWHDEAPKPDPEPRILWGESRPE